jgi:hypothetical protein
LTFETRKQVDILAENLRRPNNPRLALDIQQACAPFEFQGLGGKIALEHETPSTPSDLPCPSASKGVWFFSLSSFFLPEPAPISIKAKSLHGAYHKVAARPSTRH